MIDPKYITDYNRSQDEIEEFAIFSICVAGKNAHNTANAVEKMLTAIADYAIVLANLSPLKRLTTFVEVYCEGKLQPLRDIMKECGIGCHTGTDTVPGRAEVCYRVGLLLLVDPDFLQNCTPQTLESVKGVGAKTARFFILHSRPKQRICALDTHILKYLRDQGVEKVSKSTPLKGSKAYARLEEAFLSICDKLGKDYAEHDLWVWNKYSLDGLENRGTVKKTRNTNARQGKAKDTQS